jgi:hypothetical protein
MSSPNTDSIAKRVLIFLLVPLINLESTTGIKRLALEAYGAFLGVVFIAGTLLFFGLLNSMCPIPENCIEHQFGGGAAVLKCE